MIRKADSVDYSLLSRIWLQASVDAHHFVAREFWESQVPVMRDKYLPGAQTWVVEDDDGPAGFLCLVDDVVAGLFIAPAKQGHGLGASLLEKAKELHSRLELHVYTENPRAVDFYRRHGFRAVEERKDIHTSHNELVMVWEQQE